MQKTSRVLADTAIRGAALLGGQWVFSRVWDAFAAGPPGVDIGAGLVSFALVVLAAGIWGAVDGRTRDVSAVCWTWLGAGLLCGAVLALLVGVRGDAGLAQLVTDMLLLGPFMAALVAVPGIVGGTVVSSVRQHRDLRHY